jgi:hypothetical protein
MEEGDILDYHALLTQMKTQHQSSHNHRHKMLIEMMDAPTSVYLSSEKESRLGGNQWEVP